MSVNARPLLPSCEGQPVERALAYVEAVLVDWRPEDRLAVRAQGAGMLRNFMPSDPQAACAWLRERAREALLELDRSGSGVAATATGTRPVVTDAGAATLKKSIS